LASACAAIAGSDLKFRLNSLDSRNIDFPCAIKGAPVAIAPAPSDMAFRAMKVASHQQRETLNRSARLEGRHHRGSTLNGFYTSGGRMTGASEADANAQPRGHRPWVRLPEYPWPVLRERSPGIYETSIGSAPDPNDWVHLVVRFRAGRMQAFVNGAVRPLLDLPLLTRLACRPCCAMGGEQFQRRFPQPTRLQLRGLRMVQQPRIFPLLQVLAAGGSKSRRRSTPSPCSFGRARSFRWDRP